MASGRRHFGSVRQRSSGRWQASYFHQGKRHAAPDTFKEKKDAQKWLSTVETDILRGGWIDPRAGRILFAEYATEWLTSRPDLRPRSVIVYQSLLKCHLIPAFGKLPIASVSPTQVRTWYAGLVAEKPGSPAPHTAYYGQF